MLYLVATPIGNLADFTFRAVEVLKSCDTILCEDTRHSKILLDRYEISTPLKSFHQFSEAKKESSVIEDLKNGKQIALISDAGTPGISDPGERLVKRCYEEDLPVTSIPGPCAAVAAISASGLDTSRFQFLGFLPRKSGELKEALIEIFRYPGTTVCYESPHRICTVVELIHDISPKKKIVVARELTKKFEEFISGPASFVRNRLAEKEIKGEIILLISGAEKDETSAWEAITPREHVAYLVDAFKISEKEAIKIASDQRGVPKRTIYGEFLK